MRRDERASPPERRWIWMLGVGESLHNIGLALALLIIASLATAVGALRLAHEQPALERAPA